MRKIELQEIQDKRNQRKQLIVGIVLIGLMVLSTAGYALLSSDKTSQSSAGSAGTSNTGGSLILNKDGYQFYLSSTQEDVDKVPVSTSISLQNYTNQNVFIASQSETISSELYGVLGKYAYRIQGACYGPCSDNLPEKDCSSLLVVWTSSATPSVTQQDNCVFIKGDVSAVDAFLYNLLNDTKV